MAEKQLNINEKIKELERDIEWFYSDDFELDEASERYEEAIKKAKVIESDLKNLKNKIEVLEKDFTKD